MKKVSFEVAKALKEADYPQDYYDELSGYALSKIRYKAYSERDLTWYDYQVESGNFICLGYNYDYLDNYDNICVAPSYLEAWLWLWREKKICINCKLDKYNLLPMWWCTNEDGINYNTPNFNDPEEAIISAIEYLVDNNLIK